MKEYRQLRLPKRYVTLVSNRANKILAKHMSQKHQDIRYIPTYQKANQM
jgi:hypothetical protein